MMWGMSWWEWLCVSAGQMVSSQHRSQCVKVSARLGTFQMNTLYFKFLFLLSPVVDCGVPPSVDDGGFNVTETTFQSLAQYGCNEGLTLSGSQSRTCQADGTWLGTDPVCVTPPNSIQLGPVVGGSAAGFVVVALVTMAIIFGTVHVCKRKRRKHSTNDIQSKAFNRRSDQAALTHSHNPEIDIETSGNEAYITSAETFPNEAYITNVDTSLNKAYGVSPSTDDNYTNPQTISSGEGNDKPAMELYDYVRGELTQTHT